MRFNGMNKDNLELAAKLGSLGLNIVITLKTWSPTALAIIAIPQFLLSSETVRAIVLRRLNKAVSNETNSTSNDMQTQTSSRSSSLDHNDHDENSVASGTQQSSSPNDAVCDTFTPAASVQRHYAVVSRVDGPMSEADCKRILTAMAQTLSEPGPSSHGDMQVNEVFLIYGTVWIECEGNLKADRVRAIIANMLRVGEGCPKYTVTTRNTAPPKRYMIMDVPDYMVMDGGDRAIRLLECQNPGLPRDEITFVTMYSREGRGKHKASLLVDVFAGGQQFLRTTRDGGLQPFCLRTLTGIVMLKLATPSTRQEVITWHYW